MKKILFFKCLKTTVNAFIAGLVIGIFSIGYFFCFSTWIGYLSLSVGFLITMLYGYDNFMIKVPYVLENKLWNIIETIFSLIGNFLGIVLLSLLMNLFSYESIEIYKNAVEIVKNQIIQYNYLEIILLSFLSGILIYFGVNTYKKAEQPIARFLVLILCFVLVSYLGNYFVSFQIYCLGATLFSGEIVGKFFSVLLGNILGELLIPGLRILRGRIPSNG